METRLARSSTTTARPVPPPTKATDRPAEKPVEFVLNKSDASSVMVAGTFNGWDPKRTPLRKGPGGWKTTLWLPPGRYEYRFVANGEWMNDPNERASAPNEFGGTNSVRVVA
jgi:1,4-alpha-glucan branching enzyme